MMFIISVIISLYRRFQNGVRSLFVIVYSNTNIRPVFIPYIILKTAINGKSINILMINMLSFFGLINLLIY
ncbi:hypothetical protein C1646_716289 [Rhizophagus diaphanus]|nr:hypothetical protein C1646_716289 [Rhizophagus diaphanus] [Rhizophagus sp. MUCL 43196]